MTTTHARMGNVWRERDAPTLKTRHLVMMATPAHSKTLASKEIATALRTSVTTMIHAPLVNVMKKLATAPSSSTPAFATMEMPVQETTSALMGRVRARTSIVMMEIHAQKISAIRTRASAPTRSMKSPAETKSPARPATTVLHVPLKTYV